MTDANARAERLSLVRARRVAGPALRAGLGLHFNTSLEEDLATHVRLRLAALAGTTQATYYSDLTRMFTFAADNSIIVNWSSPAECDSFAQTYAVSVGTGTGLASRLDHARAALLRVTGHPLGSFRGTKSAAEGAAVLHPRKVRAPVPAEFVFLMADYLLATGAAHAAQALILQYDAALRPSELLAVRAGDIDGSGQLLVRVSKNSGALAHARMSRPDGRVPAPLSRTGAAAFASLSAGRSANDLVVRHNELALRCLVDAALTAVRVDNVIEANDASWTWYGVRHGRITDAAARGASRDELTRLGRWTRAERIETYVHLELRADLLRALPPEDVRRAAQRVAVHLGLVPSSAQPPLKTYEVESTDTEADEPLSPSDVFTLSPSTPAVVSSAVLSNIDTPSPSRPTTRPRRRPATTRTRSTPTLSSTSSSSPSTTATSSSWSSST